MMGKREFTERYGDPARFVYKGQYYDAGQQSRTNCTICGHVIRYVYILKNPQDRSVPISSCCFGYFEKWNNKVFLALIASQILLDTVADAITQDTKRYNAKADAAYRLSEWKRAVREALNLVRQYKKSSESDWLPKSLFELVAQTKQKPGKTVRWFDTHLPLLHRKIADAKQENPQL